MKDYYQLLEIPRNAGDDEIKKSYRAMALQYHPDRNPGKPGAEEKFKEITEAYAVLMDPVKRRKYDDFIQYAGANQKYDEPQFHYSQEEIFRDLFNNPNLYGIFNELGKEFGKSGVRFGPSFFESIFFRQGGLFVAGAIFSAFSPLNKAYKLYNFFRMAQTAHATYKQYKEAKDGAQPSVETQEEKLEGEKSLTGKLRELFGNRSVVNKDGDLSLRLQISPQEAREGVEKPLSFKVDGEEENLTVKIPPGIQDGAQLRLKGKGSRAKLGGEKGDIYLQVEIG